MKLSSFGTFFSRLARHGRSRIKTKRTGLALIAGLFLLITIPTVWLVMHRPSTVEAAWYDLAWGFRQRIPLTNSGTTQTDFQIQITYDTSTPIAASKMQSACQDIRFTDGSGKVLPYWIEPTTCNTSTTKIWVKVPSISSSNGYIYIYYGNAAATAPGNNRTTDVFIREINSLAASYNMNEASWVNDCSTGTVLDSSGNGSNGKACPSGIGPTGGATGQFNNAGLFTAANTNYLQVANSNNLTSIASAGTMSVWVKYTTNDATLRTLVDVANTGVQGLILFAQSTSCAGNNKVSLQYGTGATSAVICSTTAPTPGTWYHVVATWDSTAGRLFINGIQEGSNTTQPSILVATANTFIGSNQGTTRFFNGTMDDLQIYSKSLSQAEITDLYGTGAAPNEGYTTTNYPSKTLVRKFSSNVTVGTPATEETGAGPVGWWKLDDGTGTTTKDSGSFQTTGTITAATWQPESQCVFGKCLLFDGATAKVSMGNASTLNFSATQSFTVEGWVKTAGSTTAAYVIASKKSNGGSGSAGYMLFVNTTSTVAMTISDGSTQVGATTAANLITDNKWHYVVGVVDRTQQKIFVYIDGNLVATSASISGVGSLSNSIAYQIGATSTLNFFNGFIDDQKVYNYARSSAQIDADFLISEGRAGAANSIGNNNNKFLTDGLVAYYKMDEASWTNDCTTYSVIDSAGYSNTGGNANNGRSCPNSTGPTGGTNGLYGNAGAFDGSTQYVAVNNSNSLQFTDKMTISAWLQPTFSGGNQVVLSKWDNSGTNRSYLVQMTSAGGITFDTSTTGSDSIPVTTSGAALTNGAWSHLIITKSGTTVNFYINGKQTGNTGSLTSSTVFVGNAELRLGKDYSGGAGTTFSGQMDEVRFYNRALSAAEANQLYNYSPGPTALYRLDERSGTTAIDASGNSNPGTLTTGPTYVAGKYGSALNFDNGAYVTMPSISGINDFDVTKNYSYGFWAKFPSNQSDLTNQTNPVIEKNGGAGYSIVVRIGNSTGTPGVVSFLRFDGTNANSVNTVNRYNDNAFHHFEYVKSTNALNLYVDGKLEQTGTDTMTASTANSSALQIGKRSSNANQFKGVIDDFRIYNYARTPRQVIEDMNDHPAGNMPSPLVYYKFEEGTGTTINNSANASYSGTLFNTSNTTWTPNGKYGKGLNFDGTTAQVVIGTGISTNVNFAKSLRYLGGEMTVSAWIKPDPTDDGGWIVSKPWNGSGQYNWQIKTVSGGANPTISVQISGSSSISTTTTQTISAGNWHHIAFTLDGFTKQLTIYIDGIRSSSVSFSGIANWVPTLGDFNGNVAIGCIFPYSSNQCAGGATANDFKGTIDEVKIYDAALTPDQIKIDMNTGASVNYSSGTIESANFSNSTGTNMIGDWEFEERTGTSVKDSSTNLNTGTWSGSGNHWVVGKIGSAGNFNGSNDVVTVTDTNAIDITGDMAVSAWFKTTSAVGTNALVAKGAASDATTPYQLYLASGKPTFLLGNGTTANTAQSSLTYNDGNWHYTTGVVLNNAMTIYVDGQSVGTGTFSGSRQNTSNSLTIGKSSNGNFFYTGSIDSVKIFNYARTQDQVAFDYNRGGPVGWWKFDECQGTSAKDSSGNGNTGTISAPGTGTQTAVGDCATMGTMWGNGATGKLNGSLNFDGSDDTVLVTNPSSGVLDFGTGNFSIAAWIKPSSAATGLRIIQKGNPFNAGGQGYSLSYRGDNPGKPLNLQLNDTSNNCNSGNDSSSGLGDITGTWTHVIAVVNRNTATTTFYVNGAAKGTASEGTCSGSFTTSSNLNIPGNVSFFAGQIDDVRLYNYDLTATQAKLLYNSGAVFYGPTSGSP